MSPINRLVNKPAESCSSADDHQISQIDSRYNLKAAVILPEREDELEWISINLFEFHKLICMLYGTISEFCKRETCPKMTAGKKYEYLWSSGAQPPVEQCASNYINHTLDWIQEQLDDEQIFPTRPEDRFPVSFKETCQTIARRIFRVFAHIYHNHLDAVRMLKEEPHMNTSLKHFIYFVKEFNLLTSNQLKPLEDYIASFT